MVVARELGTNIPKSKIFQSKSYRSEIGLRRKGKDESGGDENNFAEFTSDFIVKKRIKHCRRSGTPLLALHEDWYFKEEEPSLNMDTTTDMGMGLMEEVDADEGLPAADSPSVRASEDNHFENKNFASLLSSTPVGEKEAEEKASLEEMDVEEDKTIDDIEKDECAKGEGGSPSKGHRVYYLNPNEPVFTSSKTYDEMFVFWQLLGWYNAGTDQKSDTNLFGCVQLPEPAQCFGNAETPYGPKQREFLIKLLQDDKSQTMPWPATLQSCFSPLLPLPVEEGGEGVKQLGRTSLYGSPMLDGSLGQVDSVGKVLQLLRGNKISSNSKGIAQKGNGNGNGKKEGGKKGRKEVTQQLDSFLPPETPSSWVQCDACLKWRRVAWHVDPSSLSDDWTCTKNTWDPESASCSAPQDGYNPDLESTLQTSCTSGHVGGSLSVGMWVDLYCKTNKVYYEAQVKKIKPSTPKVKSKALFHYRGWPTSFDEWVEVDNQRIQPYNMHTNPNTHDPREQERWQGLYGIETVLKNGRVPKETTGKKTAPKRSTCEQPKEIARKMPCLSPMTATTEESNVSGESLSAVL